MAIRRETHRYIKNLNREQLSNWLYQYYTEAYFECFKDFEAAMLRRVADDFGFDSEQAEKLRKGVNEDIESIQLKLVSADEIIDGLTKEGKLK